MRNQKEKLGGLYFWKELLYSESFIKKTNGIILGGRDKESEKG